ncbi:unnamed protein product, partial [Effrenium voratum]
VVFDVVATIKQPIRGVAPMETEHYNLLEPSRHPQLCRPWHGVALSAVLALGGLAVLGAQSKWSSALAVDLASKEFLVSKELPLRVGWVKVDFGLIVFWHWLCHPLLAS